MMFDFFKKILGTASVPTPANGELVIGHQDGPLRYGIKSACYGISSPRSTGGSFRLWLEVETEEPHAEHPMEALGAPHLEAGDIEVDKAEPSSILGKTFEFAIEPDAPYGGPWANLYISHHVQPHYNRITIAKNAEGQLWLTWAGECEDINYYDSRSKDIRFEVRCVVTKALDLDCEAIRERSAYFLEDVGEPFEFRACQRCGTIFMVGANEDRCLVRYYLDPDDLTRWIDLRDDGPLCPHDGSTRDELERIYWKEDGDRLLQSPWSWAVR